MPLRLDSSSRRAMPAMRFSDVRLGDRLDDARSCHLEGNLGDDDLVLAALLDDLGLAANRDRAAAGLVGLADRLVPKIVPPVGKSGPVTMSQRSSSVRSGSSISAAIASADLAEVVRRNVRRHADGDAARTVDEQLRQAPGQHDRLDALIVEVGDERRPSLYRCRPACRARCAPGALPCSGRPPAGRRRSNRSCRARRPADSAA